MNAPHAVDIEQPIDAFLQCHQGILSRLRAAGDLPRLSADAVRSRKLAADTVELFREAVLQHHADEEKELFPAVLRSAHPGEETTRVCGMIDRLVREHRVVERLWKQLEPEVRAAAAGRDAEVDPIATEQLLSAYLVHANFEEQFFLPLAEQILRRNGNHMAALGLSLHLRHTPLPAGYI